MTAPSTVVSAAARTDVGCVREHNEDTVLCGDLDGAAWSTRPSAPVGARGVAMIVCDGMGGVVGGEVASRLAADTTWA